MNILHCLIIYLPTLILAQSNEDILKQLADEVAESSSEEMVSDLADLMTDPEMQTDPKLLRKKIVQLINHPKFQEASDGRKTIKAIKLPPGIINLLNAKIPVAAKKEILDKVLGLLKKRSSFIHLLTESVKTSERLEITENVIYQEQQLPSYSAAPVNQDQQESGDDSNELQSDEDKIVFPTTTRTTTSTTSATTTTTTTRSSKPTKPSGGNKRPFQRPTTSLSQQATRPRPSRPQPPGLDNQSPAQVSDSNNFGFPSRLGEAGKDFPIFSKESLPPTSFTCEDKLVGG